VIPSGTVSRARIIPPFPFYAARGVGSRLIDLDGNEYIDCAMGFGAHLLGHAHPVVVEAIREAVGDGTGYGTPHLREVRLAELLAGAIPCAGKVTFCNSGSEATLNAIRIARAVTGKPGIAKFEGGYHGWYDAVIGSLAFEGEASGPVEDPLFICHSIGVPDENLAHTHVLPFNHDAAFEKIRRLADRLALVMVEGIQGAGGAIPARREFLRELRRVCTEAGVLLLVDEIITGFRVARGGAQEHYGVMADLATYSKAVGGGLPLGVIAGTDSVMSSLGTTGDSARDRREKAYFGGTFNGCVPAMAVGIAVLSYLEAHPDIYARLNAMGTRLRQGLRAIAAEEDYPVTVLGDCSLFMTRFVAHDVHSIRDLAGENVDAYRELFLHLARSGVFVPNTHFGLISAAHTDADIDRILEAHRQSFRELRSAGML
jgi:glutamate-1-semialdehyde 2,1-aminomutase